MQRMNGILAQLVTRSTPEAEPTERTTTEPITDAAASSSPTASSSTTQSVPTHGEIDDPEPGVSDIKRIYSLSVIQL